MIVSSQLSVVFEGAGSIVVLRYAQSWKTPGEQTKVYNLVHTPSEIYLKVNCLPAAKAKMMATQPIM